MAGRNSFLGGLRGVLGMDRIGKIRVDKAKTPTRLALLNELVIVDVAFLLVYEPATRFQIRGACDVDRLTC